MNDITKTIAGVVVGAGLVLGGSTLSAEEVIKVTDEGQPKEEVPIVIEKDETKTVTEFSGSLNDLNKIIASWDKVIAREQKQVDEAMTEKAKYVAIRNKVQLELDKLPEREVKENIEEVIKEII